MKYSERIRNLREDNEMTQAEIAMILNIRQRTYSDYERGKIRVPVDSLITLAKLYNVNMDYICGTTDIRSQFPRK